MIHLKKSAGTGAGERELNGPQTIARSYTNLSTPDFHIDDARMNVPIPVRDRIELLGHRIRFILRGDDYTGLEPIMGFRHQPIGMSTCVTVASSSRLTLSILPPA